MIFPPRKIGRPQEIDPELVRRALVALLNPDVTIMAVSKEFGIEYETLRYHMKKAEARQEPPPTTCKEADSTIESDNTASVKSNASDTPTGGE